MRTIKPVRITIAPPPTKPRKRGQLYAGTIYRTLKIEEGMTVADLKQQVDQLAKTGANHKLALHRRDGSFPGSVALFEGK